MLPGHIFLPAGEDLHDAFASNPAVEVLELEPDQRYYAASTIVVGAGTVTIKLSPTLTLTLSPNPYTP